MIEENEKIDVGNNYLLNDNIELITNNKMESSTNNLTQKIKPPKSNQNNSFRRSMPIISRPKISQYALEMKEKAMNFEPIPNLPDEIYEQIIFSLSEDRKNFVIEHKFKEGAKINRAQEFTKQFQIFSQKQEVQKKAEDELKIFEINLKQEFDEFDKETKFLEKKLEEEINNKRIFLIEQHELELLNHENKWNSEEMQKQFNHASSELTTLRSQLASLLVQSRFEEAEKIEIVINNQKLKEEIKKSEIMKEKFIESEKKILEKQNSEIEFFETSMKIKLEKFHQQRLKLRLKLENKEKKVNTFRNNVLDKDKLWNRERIKKALETKQTPLNKTIIKPSNKVKRQDIMEKEFTSLSLPPLKSSRRFKKKKN